MDTGIGSSTTTANVYSTGQPLYFGYVVTPTREVQLTGAELVEVPEVTTVEGVYAVKMDNGKYPLLAGCRPVDGVKGGYASTVHPLSDVVMPEGGMGDWWIVAKVVPRQAGLGPSACAVVRPDRVQSCCRARVNRDLGCSTLAVPKRYTQVTSRLAKEAAERMSRALWDAPDEDVDEVR